MSSTASASESAVEHARASHPVDLATYQALRAYVARVSAACAGADLRLAAVLQDIVRRTWAHIRAALAACVSPRSLCVSRCC